MSRIHIGLNVEDVARSATFYTHLFGSEPTVKRDDYAKWMLDDPKVNFSISSFCGEKAGDVHFGVQVESKDELDTISQRLSAAGEAVLPEENTVCCYHQSDKAWVLDPESFRWETFVTHGESTQYGQSFEALQWCCFIEPYCS